MKRTTIEIYQGIIWPSKLDPLETMDIYIKSIIDLRSIKELIFPLCDNIVAKVKIDVLPKITNKIEKIWQIYKEYIVPELILKIETIIEFSDKFDDEIENIGFDSNEVYKDELLYFFEKRYYDFILTLDIARVGAFNFGLGLVFQDQKFRRQTNDICIYSKNLLEYSLDKKWPSFEQLDIAHVWKWYVNKVSFNDLDEISSTPLGRAINSMSYLYKKSNHLEELFWSMVGIEALYVVGKEAIVEQIKRKSQLFLGEITEFKKRIGTMYSFRSKFIHGAQNFPSYFHCHEGKENYNRFLKDFSETSIIAKVVLIATLQKMAKNNWSELNFEYNIKGV